MKSRPQQRRPGWRIGAIALLGGALCSATGAGAQTAAAPLFADGRMLRPLVQDVLVGSPFIADCAPVAETRLALTCTFANGGADVLLALDSLLERVKAPDADPRAEILDYANRVLIDGDPERVFPKRAHLRPLVRARKFVAQASAEERMPDSALFPVPGFPAATAFAVIDEATTVHLVRRPDDPRLGLDSFNAIMARAQDNAGWLNKDAGVVDFACGVEPGKAYCSLRLDGFYESSLVTLDGFTGWLAERLEEPALIAIPARDEVLIAPLSNRQAIADLDTRLDRFRPFAITHDVAFWAGQADAPLEPVARWSLRGGVLLPARVTVRKGDGTVLSFAL